MFRIAVLVSGGGSNLSAIIGAIEQGKLKCSISAVISDRPKIGAIQTAKKKGIPDYVFNTKGLKSKNSGQENPEAKMPESKITDSEPSVSDRILEVVKGKTDLIVCAGFLSILEGNLLEEFHNRIINIHPALIPSFCGKGMYGIRVHQAALDYGVKISGCTVHFLETGVDTGPVILQRSVEVLPEDSAEDLQMRILTEEHIAIVDAVKLICENKIDIKNRKVIIRSMN